MRDTRTAIARWPGRRTRRRSDSAERRRSPRGRAWPASRPGRRCWLRSTRGIGRRRRTVRDWPGSIPGSPRAASVCRSGGKCWPCGSRRRRGAPRRLGVEVGLPAPHGGDEVGQVGRLHRPGLPSEMSLIFFPWCRRKPRRRRRRRSSPLRSRSPRRGSGRGTCPSRRALGVARRCGFRRSAGPAGSRSRRFACWPSRRRRRKPNRPPMLIARGGGLSCPSAQRQTSMTWMPLLPISPLPVAQNQCQS